MRYGSRPVVRRLPYWTSTQIFFMVSTTSHWPDQPLGSTTVSPAPNRRALPSALLRKTSVVTHQKAVVSPRERDDDAIFKRGHAQAVAGGVFQANSAQDNGGRTDTHVRKKLPSSTKNASVLALGLVRKPPGVQVQKPTAVGPTS